MINAHAILVRKSGSEEGKYERFGMYCGNIDYGFRGRDVYRFLAKREVQEITII
jgi:hypothetical protein